MPRVVVGQKSSSRWMNPNREAMMMKRKEMMMKRQQRLLGKQNTVKSSVSQPVKIGGGILSKPTKTARVGIATPTIGSNRTETKEKMMGAPVSSTVDFMNKMMSRAQKTYRVK